MQLNIKMSNMGSVFWNDYFNLVENAAMFSIIQTSKLTFENWPLKRAIHFWRCSFTGLYISDRLILVSVYQVIPGYLHSKHKLTNVGQINLERLAGN